MLAKKLELELLKEKHTELSAMSERDGSQEFAYKSTVAELKEAVKVHIIYS